MAQVRLTAETKEDLRDLDVAVRKQVLKGLRKLESEPEKRGDPLGSRIRTNLSGYRKLVVGNRDYRVIYQVCEDGSVVMVWVIAARTDDECYKIAQSRLALHPDRDLAEAASKTMRQVWEG